MTESDLSDILGMSVKDEGGSITLSHSKYISKLAERYLEGDELRKHQTPASDKLPDLVNAALDSHIVPDASLVQLYQSLVGALLFAAITARPDISYAVGMLCRVMNKPTPALLIEAKRVLHYLANTKDMGLRYVRGSQPRLYGMSDSDWSTRRSTSGFVFFLAGAAIAYLSKKQPTIALSSTEAEIMAASLAAVEAIYLRALLEILGCAVAGAVDLYIDNKGAIALSLDYVSGPKTKHIERRHLKIRELVEEAKIAVKHVTSANNVADIFTKPLDKSTFKKLRAMVLNLPRAE